MDITNIAWDNDVAGLVVGIVGDEVVCILPMIYTHRVTIGFLPSHRGDGWYEHAWCYPDMAGAIAAVAEWNPETEATPVGYIKQATPGLRPLPSHV